MDRPPRNPAVERLVSRRLISFSYFQIGLMQAAAGFLAFMAVMNDYGYEWSNLIGRGIEWPNAQLVCNPTFASDGVYAQNCGFACGSPPENYEGSQTLYGQRSSTNNEFCVDGCPIPFNVSRYIYIYLSFNIV